MRFVVEQLHEIVRTAESLADLQVDAIERATDALVSTFAHGKKLLLFGNGGSAAAAQHLAAEFVGRFRRDRRPLPALALSTDTSAITAIANDYGFDMVFARQIRALGCPGDTAIAISTSGRSPNVLKGVAVAAEMRLNTIGLTGADGGPLVKSVAIPIVVPGQATARIQEFHLAIGHMLCESVEAALGIDNHNGVQVPSLLQNATPSRNKLKSWPELLHLRERWRSEGKRVVWTNGCFDLLHAGHLSALLGARDLGDMLVVGINDDDSVRRLKGPERPIVPAAERAELVAALECVDAAIIFEELTPEAALGRLRPDIHCKGAEYAPADGMVVHEARVVASHGGRVAFLPMLPGHSTTDLMERIRESRVHEP